MRSQYIRTLIDPALAQVWKFWMAALHDYAVVSLPMEYSAQLPVCSVLLVLQWHDFINTLYPCHRTTASSSVLEPSLVLWLTTALLSLCLSMLLVRCIQYSCVLLNAADMFH